MSSGSWRCRPQKPDQPSRPSMGRVRGTSRDHVVENWRDRESHRGGQSHRGGESHRGRHHGGGESHRGGQSHRGGESHRGGHHGGGESHRGGVSHRGGHRGWGRGRGGGGSTEQRRGGHGEPRKPVNPMSYHVLRTFAAAESDDLLLVLVSPSSGFREMLSSLKDENQGGHVELVLNVLAKAVQATFSPQNLLFLLQMITQTNFLMGPAARALKESSAILHLLKIVSCYQEKMPTQSLQIVIALLPLIEATLVGFLRNRVPDDINSAIRDIRETDIQIQREFQRGDLMRHQGGTREEPEAPCDFRRLSVIPSSADIQPNVKPFIRKNRINGSYRDANEYLDVQFRLLREDCIRPLREGIKEYRRNLDRGKMTRLQDIRVYEHAQILEPYSGNRAVVHLIKFDVSTFRKVNWETSKRLISGSLLCFSKDNFETALFGTIVDRDVMDLEQGLLYIQFEGLNIQLLNSNPFEEYIMVESGAYFESYVHNLEGLKEFNNRTLPFQKYLLCNEEETKVLAPKYLLNKPTTYDFSSIVVNKLRAIRYKTVNPLDPNAWPSREEMELDPSQYKAIQTAVTKEYSVIQGPPGTGKTFLGLKICRILLENKDVWLPNNETKPILVVCYTNHALDQFLDGILEFTEPFDRTGRIPQVARLGGRVSSKNVKLQQCLLKNIKDKARLYRDREIRVDRRDIREMIREEKDGKETIKEQINILSREIEWARKCVIHEYYLWHLMTHKQNSSLMRRRVQQGQSVIKTWLLEGMVIQQQNKGADQKTAEKKEHDTQENLTEKDEFQEDDYGGEEEMAKRVTDDFNIDKYRTTSHGQAPVVLSVDEIADAPSGHHSGNGNKWQQVRTKKDVKELKQYMKSKDCMGKDEADSVQDVWMLSRTNRWRLYHYWMALYCEDKMLRMRTLHRQYDTYARRLGELYDEEDFRVLRHCAIIGMTTTGAAKFRRLVKRIAPLIVIVEEAAEVLEAHIITALNQYCQHVILIGDHQQLRPSPTNYELAKDYHLNVSLFERMVKNKLHCDTLRIQHRMRPEISALIVPHIYDRLENHESVSKYENIKGVQGNLFFISHTMKELSQEDTRSHSNEHEAAFLVGLYDYFLKQGYQGSQITILTLYTGQMFAIKRLLKRLNLEFSRVTPVDNYQGEENDIILLSLVRSNEMGSIGFLKTSNRVCVALSRARKGFYVIGNMTQMQESSYLWNSIIGSLKEKDRVVEALPLACQNHPDTVTMASSPKDFNKAPKGGCMRPCDFRLDCGHVCEFLCHPKDPEHEYYKCQKPCTQRCQTFGENGEEGHLCVNKCFEKCGNCEVRVIKEIPKCGHTQRVPCFQKPEDYKCQITCNKPCTTNGEEAHLCKKKCSEDCGDCVKLVRKQLPICNHSQMVPCSRDPWCFSCELPCEKRPFSCDHVCPLLCGDQCSDICVKIVVKELPCGHPIDAKCSSNIGDLKCKQQINRKLPCGHNIKVICSQDLSKYKCDEKVTTKLDCGHTATLTCYQIKAGLVKEFKCHVPLKHVCRMNPLHSYTAPCSDYFRSFFGCKEKCDVELSCGHRCQGKCGDCLGQYHPQCTAACDRILPCGHPCNSNCGEPCKPCEFNCNSCCPHNFCQDKCGNSCVQCQSICSWSCSHQTCGKLCWQVCDRVPCDEPCPNYLPCGHRCIGFCGEPCPLFCFWCNGAHQHYTGKWEETRFVQVYPCCHVIESNRLAEWFQQYPEDESHVFTPILCPQCHHPVSYCPRFGHILKRNAREYSSISAGLRSAKDKLEVEVGQLKKALQRKLDISVQRIIIFLRKNTKFIGNWFSNPDFLVFYLIGVQMSSLIKTEAPLVPLEEADQIAAHNSRCKQLSKIASNIIDLHHRCRKGYIKELLALEVVFALLSNQTVTSPEAKAEIKSITTSCSRDSSSEFELKATAREIFQQHSERAVWVVCPVGHVFREKDDNLPKRAPREKVRKTCFQCLAGEPVEDEVDTSPHRNRFHPPVPRYPRFGGWRAVGQGSTMRRGPTTDVLTGAGVEREAKDSTDEETEAVKETEADKEAEADKQAGIF